MSLLTNFQDLTNSVKLALSRKADKSEIPVIPELATVATSGSYNDLSDKPTIPTAGTITSGSTGYATGGDVYTAIGNIPQIPVGSNTGDILVWDGYDWVSKPKWQITFQPVEYIESTGTQYIDTGVKVKQTTRILSEEAQTQLSSYSLQGISDSNSSFAVLTWGTTSRLQYFESRVGTVNASWNYTNVPIDTQIHKYDLSSGSQKIDNNQYGTSTIPNGYESYRNIILFARFGDAHQVSTPEEFAKVRIKTGQIYEGDTLIRDFIPVYNVFTGEAGLFDKIDSKFYGNQGTGTFLKGADV